MKAIRALLIVGVLGLAGCSDGTPATAGPPSAAAPASAAASASAAVGFGGTDLAWIEVNIALDEQLLPLLQLVPTHSADSAVRAAAQQVRALTDAELSTLRRLHDRAGLPAANPHKGMPMPGMVTLDEVGKAGRLTGPAFDKEALAQLEAYLEQSRNLARNEDESGVEQQTRALATQILRTRGPALSTVHEAR